MRRHTRPRQRRAAALAGAVLVLTIVNLAVISAVAAGTGDMMVAGWRVDALRAHFATESGIHVFISETEAGRATPSKPYTLPGGETVSIGQVVANEVPIQGESRDAVRQRILPTD